MKNYTFKKVDEKPMLDSPVWNDVEKATLDNDNFCGENAEKITVTAQGVCTKYGITVKFESDEKNPVIKYSHANQPAQLRGIFPGAVSRRTGKLSEF